MMVLIKGKEVLIKMVMKNAVEKFSTAMSNYENVRKAILGLHEIIKINLQEKNLFYQVAMDNLKALNENVVELLNKSFTPREVRIRLRELEFDEKEAEKIFPL